MKADKDSQRTYTSRKNPINRFKASMAPIILIAVAVVAVIALAITGIWHGKQKKIVEIVPTPSVTDGSIYLSTDKGSQSVSSNINLTPTASSSTQSDIPESSGTSSEETSKPDDETPESTVDKEGLPETDKPVKEELPVAFKAREEFSSAVTEKETSVDNSYFDDAVFFGDSFAYGIDAYISPIIPKIEVMVLERDDSSVEEAAAAEEIISDSEEPEVSEESKEGEAEETLEDAPKDKTEEFFAKAEENLGDRSKVYLSFGTDWLDMEKDAFAEKYTRIIKKAKSHYPKATIYVQGIMPVSENAELQKQYPYMVNSRINEYNMEIMNIATEQEAYYLDIPVVIGQELFDFATPDGVHLTGQYYYDWLRYIKKHTVQ